MKWNYESDIKSSNGYEDVLKTLKSYTKELYMSKDEYGKQSLIKEVFNIYRSKNIFPITYYNADGIKDEIQKCIDKNVSFDGDVLDLKFNQGQSLCRFLFPNMQNVVVKGVENNSPYHKFHDDHKLYRAIKFCLDHKTIAHPVVPSAIKDGLEMLGGGVATNFKAMNAKALYEKYCPRDGLIYDYASGFGGRLLGALSSKNNYKYIGVEPCTETFAGLNRLGRYIEVTKGVSNTFKIFQVGSEDFYYSNEFVDFAFSSPPYFNLEKYSDEETQCYNKFNTLELWYEGYVRKTIKNIYAMLKHDRYYAVNIADFNIGNKRVEFVNDWIRMSEEEGFVFTKEIFMTLQKRRGAGHGDNTRTKREGIYVFYKK